MTGSGVCVCVGGVSWTAVVCVRVCVRLFVCVCVFSRSRARVCVCVCVCVRSLNRSTNSSAVKHMHYEVKALFSFSVCFSPLCFSSRT